jgi:DNA-binding response OmpR family regulator
MHPVAEPTVLVVDDDLALTRALSGFLRRHGFPVLTATSASEALRSAIVDGPDIVICDRHLGDDDGTEVLRTLRESVAPCPRCILMSGKGAVETTVDLGVPCLFKGPTFLPHLRVLLGIDGM